MLGYRDHAFADEPVYDLVRTSPVGLMGRFWTRLALEVFWRVEREQVKWAVSSFRTGAVVGEGSRIGVRAWCANPGPKESIRLGNSVICRGIVRSESFHPGKIRIGDNVYIGDAAIISCAERIEIGAFTMLAHGVQVFDNDSHPVDPVLRQRDQLIAVGLASGERPNIGRAPIIVGEIVWIVFNATILKGVRIGNGSIVAAGSVVTSDIPPMVVAAGNPARVLSEIVPVSSGGPNQ